MTSKKLDLLLALVLHLIAIASHELLDAAGSVDQLLLASVERVAESADFQVYHEVIDTIDAARVIGLGGADARPFVLAVDEQNRVRCGMNSFLHVLNLR